MEARSRTPGSKITALEKMPHPAPRSHFIVGGEQKLTVVGLAPGGPTLKLPKLLLSSLLLL